MIDLPIEIETPGSRPEVFPVLADLMERHRLTAYDAVYLELVIRRKLPLASLDAALIDACKALGERVI